MVENGEKNFDKQLNRKSVSTILKDLIQHSQLEEKETDKDKIKHLYFRGESSYYSLRTPGLYRNEKLSFEGSEYYYRMLINELGRDDYQENSTLVRLISELQHYGAETRMLDITRNPLIALYFAVEEDNKEPGFVFIFESDETDEKFDTGHTIAIKSALNLISQKVINDFFDSIENIKTKYIENLENLENLPIFEIEKYLSNSPEDNSYINHIKQFMELLNQRARVRESLIYPFKIYNDLQKSHIVIPSRSTDRIKQQQGAFIYPKFVNCTGKTHMDIKNEISESINELCATLKTRKEDKNMVNDDSNNLQNNNNNKILFSVIKIDAGNKKEIKKQLELLGITKGFVYPDIQHLSETLLNKHYNKTK